MGNVTSACHPRTLSGSEQPGDLPANPHRAVPDPLRPGEPRPPGDPARAGEQSMRILVVEDEARLAALLNRSLEEEGHAVDLAASGEEGLDWTATATYDAIVLDIMLPGIDGFEVAR